MRFYRLTDDKYYNDRWFLGKIPSVDNWSLYSKAPESTENLSVSVNKNGNEMDFTLMSAYAVPIVSDRLKDVLSVFSGVDFIPVKVNGFGGDYFVMIINNVIECVNESDSEYQKFEIDDPVRPDKAGSFRAFFKLVIDPAKVIGMDIFRINRFELAIIVSESVKKVIENLGATGTEFSLVG